MVRVSDFFQSGTPNLKLGGLIPHAIASLIWISTAVYNLQHYQRPAALMPCLRGVGGFKKSI